MIAILSNVTLGPFLVNTVERLTGQKPYQSPGYNTWVQDLLGEGLPLAELEAVFLVLDGRELLGETGLTDGDRAREALSTHLAVIDQFTAAHPQLPLFVSSLDIEQRAVLPLVARRVEPLAMAFWRQELDARGLPVLELAELAARFGRERFYSRSLWYLGSLPYSMHGEKLLAAELDRCWRALRGKRKKCLVLDLDNTLWGGVIGEDGVGGITLGTAKEGARFRDFQKRILDLKKQGTILAVVSKNNPEDALEAINGHPDMVLREADFVAIKTNWEPKALNIETLAHELNLGLDSFVFLDDNPVERETVKMALPTLTVPEFPQDTNNLEDFLIALSREHFPVLRLTREDLRKSEQYREEQQRTESKKAFTSVEDFLKSLEMRLVFRPLAEGDVVRAAQLTQKTNQFNLRTVRYTEADVRRLRDDPAWRLWIGELSDKFGDYGKIVLCFARITGETAFIDTFLMSCRVMGRLVEACFLGLVERELAGLGVKDVRSEFVASQKNSVVRDFWSRQHYQAADPAAPSEGSAAYVRSLTAARSIPEYITVVADQASERP